MRPGAKLGSTRSSILAEEGDGHDEHGDREDKSVGHDAGTQLAERGSKTVLERPLIVVRNHEEMEHQVKVNLVENASDEDADEGTDENVADEVDTLIDTAIGIDESPSVERQTDGPPTDDERKEGGQGEAIGCMGRREAVKPASVVIDRMDKVLHDIVMGRTEPLEKWLH